MQDESPFAFAGIWDEWQADGNAIASCAIITTVANELLASIHDRMPVILSSESHKWLDDASELGTLRDLLAPFPASEMMSHPVSYDVSHPKIDDEYLTRPVEPNIGVTLSLFSRERKVAMSVEFKDLKLEGSFIREISFVPSRTVRIEVRTAPQNGEKQVSVLYELVFDQVHWFRSDLEAEPWLEIRSHNMIWPSDYLPRRLAHQSGGIKDIQPESGHFQFILDEGQIDIVAEQFIGSVVEEIPVISLEEIQIQGLTGQHGSADEQRCSFCNKAQSDVSKLITDKQANICNECVSVCAELIAQKN